VVFVLVLCNLETWKGKFNKIRDMPPKCRRRVTVGADYGKRAETE
jgi:hypothetical protein